MPPRNTLVESLRNAYIYRLFSLCMMALYATMQTAKVVAHLGRSNHIKPLGRFYGG